MINKSSIQFCIHANEQEQEILIGLFSDLDVMGFEQQDKVLLAYFKEPFTTRAAVNQLLNHYQYESYLIEDQNWNALWEQNFNPVIIGNFCSIRAEFHPPSAGVEHEIIITPKMSFGTGHHATTSMMIEQMQFQKLKNKTVFDFGSGTGVLAILSEKMGARSVTATDDDEWSQLNAIENISRNFCQCISFHCTNKIPEETFDVILANINRNVLLDYLPSLVLHLSPGGRILLSGFLTSDENMLVEACRLQQLLLIQRMERNNWVSLCYSYLPADSQINTNS